MQTSGRVEWVTFDSFVVIQSIVGSQKIHSLVVKAPFSQSNWARAWVSTGYWILLWNEHLILIFFVDDVVILHQIKDANNVEECQTKQFKVYEIRYLGLLEWFLGIQVVQDWTSHLWLCQSSYIDKIIPKYNISIKSKHPAVPLPLVELVKLLKKVAPKGIFAYQQCEINQFDSRYSSNSHCQWSIQAMSIFY